MEENKMEERTLRIPENPQYGVIVEDPKNIENSLFFDVYKNAADCVKKIITANELNSDDKKSTSHNTNSFFREEFLNTVISFTGDRGSGKSSGMMTFAGLLKESTTVGVWEPIEASMIEKRFWTLRAIDSTHMGQNERLLTSISSRLYQEYKDHQNERLSRISIDKKRDFLQIIQEVNKLSYMFIQGEWTKNEAFLLQNSTELGSLRKKVQEMVKCFLEMMFGECNDNTYLVISIDDLDMNLENSFDLVDDIRKFLTIKHVIVLTSVDIEQLKELVCRHFQKPFNGGTNNGEVIGQMYIEKIFPITRQMQMPKLSTEQLGRCYIENLLGNDGETTRKSLGLPTEESRGLSTEKKENDKGKKIYPKKLTISEGVLHLVYRKTMLLLVPEDNGRHWLIPHNLRELCNFIYLLQKMDDVAFDGDKLVDDKKLLKKLPKMEENLLKLMQYIVSDLLDYSTVHMDAETKKMAGVLTKLIRDLPEWTLVTMNKKIVQEILTQVMNSELYKRFYNIEKMKALLDATYRVHLISTGDVQHVLGALSLRSNDYTIKRLVEYIRVIWSIRMTMEFYCVGVKYNKTYEKSELYVKPYITYSDSPDNKKLEKFEGGFITNAFRETVGGLMVNPDSTNMLKVSQDCMVNIGKNSEDCDWLEITVTDDNKEIIYGSNIGAIAVLSLNHNMPRNADKYKWRNTSFKAYYKNNTVLDREVNYIYLNYMALFTNLLSTKDIGYKAGTAENKYTKDYVSWQEKNIITFPFYSMDWMNRFYRELKEMCEEAKTAKNLKNAFEDLHERIERTCVKVQNVTRRYITIDDAVNANRLISNNYSSRIEKLKNDIFLTNLTDTLNTLNTLNVHEVMLAMCEELIKEVGEGKRNLSANVQNGMKGFIETSKAFMDSPQKDIIKDKIIAAWNEISASTGDTTIEEKPDVLKALYISKLKELKIKIEENAKPTYTDAGSKNAHAILMGAYIEGAVHNVIMNPTDMNNMLNAVVQAELEDKLRALVREKIEPIFNGNQD